MLGFDTGRSAEDHAPLPNRSIPLQMVSPVQFDPRTL
jgi:hypothetical protein